MLVKLTPMVNFINICRLAKSSQVLTLFPVSEINVDDIKLSIFCWMLSAGEFHLANKVLWIKPIVASWNLFKSLLLLWWLQMRLASSRASLWHTCLSRHTPRPSGRPFWVASRCQFQQSRLQFNEFRLFYNCKYVLFTIVKQTKILKFCYGWYTRPQVRLLPTDEDYSMRGETLTKAIQEDREKVRSF